MANILLEALFGLGIGIAVFEILRSFKKMKKTWRFTHVRRPEEI